MKMWVSGGNGGLYYARLVVEEGTNHPWLVILWHTGEDVWCGVDAADVRCELSWATPDEKRLLWNCGFRLRGN